MSIKLAVLGCGLRTPLLLHGLAKATDLAVSEITLFDKEPVRAQMMAALAGPLLQGTNSKAIVCPTLESAIEDASFVINSVRPGGIEARARDERLMLLQGYAGQETTGPGGLAMALRGIPVALEQAHVVERRAPRAWIVNFTNPAGIITQAIAQHSGARVVGICDTPSEIFHRIAWALHEPHENLVCDYIGLNHLGWVRQVLLQGVDVTQVLLNDDALLRRLYPAELFAPALIRQLGLIPTEYLYFYYAQSQAVHNQLAAGATRGEELAQMNHLLIAEIQSHLEAGHPHHALDAYRAYLNRRNASYLRLEAAGESALAQPDPGWDPFEGETGYHRIAVDTIRALSGTRPARLVLNVLNHGACPDLQPADSIEVPCLVDKFGPRPTATGPLPECIRGLVIAVKNYERYAIRAALENSAELAAMALLANPIVGEWKPACDLIDALIESDPRHLGYLRPAAVPVPVSV